MPKKKHSKRTVKKGSFNSQLVYGTIAIVLIIIALPFTFYLAKQQQHNTQYAAGYSGMACGGDNAHHCQPPGYHRCSRATGGVCGPQFNCCADSDWNYGAPPKGQVSQGGGYINEPCGSGGRCVDANTNASGCGPVNTGVCKNDLHPLKCCTGGGSTVNTKTGTTTQTSSTGTKTTTSSSTVITPAAAAIPATTVNNPYSKCGTGGNGLCYTSDLSKNKNVGAGYTCTYNTGICASNSTNKYCCTPTNTSSAPTQRLACVGDSCQYITGTGSQGGCQSVGDVCGSNGLVSCAMLRGCCTIAGTQGIQCPLASSQPTANVCPNGQTCYPPAHSTYASLMFGPTDKLTIATPVVLAAQITIAKDFVYYDQNVWDAWNQNFRINGVTPGSYGVILHVNGYLNKQVVNPTSNQFSINQGQQAFTIPHTTLIPGDVAPQPDGDNIIDIQDYNLVAGCLGVPVTDTATTTCPHPEIADTNKDGVINQSDLDIIIANFGKKGDYFLEKPATYNCQPDPSCTGNAKSIQLCPLKCTQQ